MIEVVTQFQAMETLLHHMAAGYRVLIHPQGDDGSLGYHLETERRDGNYVHAHGATMPLAAVALVEKLT